MEETGEHSKKKKAKLGVVYATGRAIQRKNASPPVGYARRLDIGMRIVQRKDKTEEEHPAVEEAEINQVPGKGTSQKKEELTLYKEEQQQKVKQKQQDKTRQSKRIRINRQ